MFGNPFDLHDEFTSENKSAPDPFGRLGEDDEPDTEIAEIKNPTRLASSVGDSGQNSRRDVAKMEQLLGEVGTLDLKKTDGPTGYWGARTSDATKAFQKQNDLKVDGQINPGGETIRALGKLAGQAVKVSKPSNNVVIPAKAGTQSTATTNWVPDQVRDDKGDEGSNALKLTDEAFSENTRAARYLASRDGIGDFSKFVADGIETDGNKAIAETVDLYKQTRELNPNQADALIDKVLPGLGPDNAKRLQSALMPRMDEKGDWFDATGIPIPNPNADPRILKAAAPSVPVPSIPTLPGGINPATPDDIDKALQNVSKDVRKAWEELKNLTGITDADLFNTPLGKALLMGDVAKQGLGKVMAGSKRTDIAEPQPHVPGFPSKPGIDLPHHTEGRSTEPDRVIDPPEFVPPPTGAETGNPSFPDQSDDPDINGAQVVEYDKVNPPRDLAAGDPLTEAVDKRLNVYDSKRRKDIEKVLLSDGVITSAGLGGMNIEAGKDAKKLQGDWEQAIRDLGGDPNGPNTKSDEDGVRYRFPDGTVIMVRGSKEHGPTLHIQIPAGPKTASQYDIKKRYR